MAVDLLWPLNALLWDNVKGLKVEFDQADGIVDILHGHSNA